MTIAHHKTSSLFALGCFGATRPGRIWLDKGLKDDERTEVACFFAGLMLYKPKENR